jgi:hypothetical protein
VPGSAGRPQSSRRLAIYTAIGCGGFVDPGQGREEVDSERHAAR